MIETRHKVLFRLHVTYIDMCHLHIFRQRWDAAGTQAEQNPTYVRADVPALRCHSTASPHAQAAHAIPHPNQSLSVSCNLVLAVQVTHGLDWTFISFGVAQNGRVCHRSPAGQLVHTPLLLFDRGR